MKVLKGCLFSLIIAITVIFLLIISLYIFPLPMQKKDIERDISKKQTDIKIVTEFFSDLEYDAVYISDFDESGLMSTGLEYGDIPVGNADVIAAIDRLINKHGYEIIGKRENAVYFQRWSHMENKRGAVYSITGQIPSESSFNFLIHIEPLTEENWYYYEEDFNKWESEHSYQ